MSRATIQGLPISPGLAVAPVFRLRQLPFQVGGRRTAGAEVAAELERLEQACRQTRQDLVELEGEAAGGPMTSMLDSPLFHGSVIDRIQAGCSAGDAVVQTTYDLVVIFSELPDPILRARAEDVDEVGRRLFRGLHGLRADSQARIADHHRDG